MTALFGALHPKKENFDTVNNSSEKYKLYYRIERENEKPTLKYCNLFRINYKYDNGD